MRRAILLSLSLILGGCVPTADFVDLRDEVRRLEVENRKFKDIEAELRKRLEEADRLQKAGDIAKQLDVLEAKIESLRIRQQGFDQKLGELLRRMDESARQEEKKEPALPQAKAPTPSAKPDDTAKPRAGGLDAPTAALTPTAAYNQAYNDYLKGNYDLAVAGFEEFLKKFPETSLTAHAQYWIVEAYFNKRSYSQAIEAYERVIANYPKSGGRVPAVSRGRSGQATARRAPMTPQIAVLPGDVINKIAAGEVVERPASVVKELVENAIDAGATRVSVDVEQAGRRSIRVTDDGQGIASEEAALAFQRHATSKIRTEADLSTIQSMGFRGEALPSIAAVSKVRLVTVAAGSSMGTEVRLEGGALLAQRETAAAPGTTVEVTDLFYNTPARKKFLKSPATEFGHVCQAVQRQALAFPKIHFRLTHNGYAVADYPAVPTLRDRVQQVYGAQLVDTCVDLQEETGRLRLEGLCTRPLETAHTKTPQDLFVNCRWVKNAAIVHALYEGYGTYLARGHQPRFVLSLWVDPRQVDVNVHPTKREVRFSDQEQVHEWVRSRIQASVKPASVASRTTVVSAWPPPQRRDQPVATDGSRDVPGYANPAPDVLAGRQPRPAGVAELGQAYLPTVDQEEVRPLGQIANRYLVAQVGDEVQIVDQHTAHERVLFERLLRQFEAGQITSQRALLPQVVELSAAEAVSVRAHLEDLGRLGKAVSSCGPCRRSSAKATSEPCCARWWKIGTRAPRRLRCRNATIPSSRPWRATARCGRDGRWKSRRCGGCWRTGARRGCPARARTGAASPCA